MRPEAHATFARALLAPAAPVPEGLRASRRAGDGAAPARRFAVHRNTVVVGLVDALAARFPVTQRLLGEAFFRAAAREFALAHPPRSRILMAYGDALPGFLAGFPPAASVPFAADLARLEAALARAAHAEDAVPARLDALAAVAPEALDDARLRLHPALEVVGSRHPIVSIHAAESGAGAGPVDMGRGEDALVLRPALDATARRLAPGGRRFVEALGAGAALGAAARAGAVEPGFDLAGVLSALFAGGGVVAVDPGRASTEGREPA